MAVSSRQVKNKRDSNGVLTGRPGTVYDVNIKYTAPDGKKKSYAKKGFATKKEATQHEAEMKTKLQNPGQIASITSQRKQTVASYLNDWVESYARVNLRPSTYDGYKKTIANYINPYIGGVALNQLTPAMVAFYSPAWDLGTIWAPLAENAPPKQAIKETPRTRKNIVFMRVSGVF